MTRQRLGGLASIMVAALLSLGAPAPATAVGDIIWLPALCATGELTGYTVDTSRTPGPTLRIQGWIEPCARAGRSNGFAIMYHTPRMNYILSLVRYQRLDGTSFTRTGFIWEISALPESRADGLRGLCLARSYEDWLSCVSVEWDPDGIPRLTPVPPSDPGLQAPIKMGSPGNQYCTHPGCGSCVAEPTGAR